ncbi:MAG: hypothetical protein WCJ35_25690 [Planctomycetota bacterium]
MRTSVDFSADPEQSSTMLDAMDDCMPRGALFERLNDKDFGRSCGYAKLCPWCHARSVQKLYRKLTAGVCSPENLKGKKLVLARVCYRNSIRSPFLDRREVRKTREFYREQARGIADDLGLDGGAIFYQFGPMREYGVRNIITNNTFSPEVTMIGESSNLSLSLESYEYSGYDLLCLPADTHQALRYLLFGTSYKYPVDRIEGLKIMSRCFDKGHVPRFTKYGIPGAASLQPWFLFNETQAWSYLQATAGTRLYDTFGTWRGNPQGNPGTKDRETETRITTDRETVARITEDRDPERVSHAMAFRHANNERMFDASNRRVGLMRKAETVFRNLKSKMGRNPGSKAIQTAMSVAGHAISDRDSRWLVKQLPLYCQEEELESFWPELTERNLANDPISPLLAS